MDIDAEKGQINKKERRRKSFFFIYIYIYFVVLESKFIRFDGWAILQSGGMP